MKQAPQNVLSHTPMKSGPEPSLQTQPILLELPWGEVMMRFRTLPILILLLLLLLLLLPPAIDDGCSMVAMMIIMIMIVMLMV